MLLQREELSELKQNLMLREPAMDDVPEIIELLNICAIDQTGRRNVNRSELLADWTAPRFDPATCVRVAETGNGKIIGYIEVWDTDPLPVNNWVWARVHPDFEGLGTGTMLMKWAEKRLQRTLLRVPEDLRVVYHAGALGTHGPSKEFLEGFGMRLQRYFWRMVTDLERTIPDPAWPEGISMKSLVEVDDLGAVYRAFNDAFRDHWGYVEQPEAESIAKWEHWISSDKMFDPALWFTAMDGDEIAGVCLCRQQEYEDPDMGWVNILGVRRPWRKQGLGLAMLYHAFRKFKALDKLRAGLGVDANSLTGATRLYKRAGMRVTREFHTYVKELRPGRDIGKRAL